MVVFCVILLWWPFYPHPTPPLIIQVCMVVLGVMSFSCCGGCLCQWPKCNPDVVCEPVCSDRGVRPWLQRCGHHLWAHAVCDWRHTGGERLLWHPLHAQRQGPAEWPQGGKGENPATQLPHLIPSLPFFLPSLNVCFVQMLDKLLKGEWRLGGSVMMGSRVWSAVKEMLIYYYLRNIDEYIYIYTNADWNAVLRDGEGKKMGIQMWNAIIRGGERKEMGIQMSITKRTHSWGKMYLFILFILGYDTNQEEGIFMRLPVSWSTHVDMMCVCGENFPVFFCCWYFFNIF